MDVQKKWFVVKNNGHLRAEVMLALNFILVVTFLQYLADNR